MGILNISERFSILDDKGGCGSPPAANGAGIFAAVGAAVLTIPDSIGEVREG